MAKRHKDAVMIQGGACNPIPISKALYDACMEVHHEGGNAREDAAVRLIAHQLSYILGVPAIDYETSVYTRLIDECEEKAK